LLIWAFATIDVGVHDSDFLSQAQSQLPGQLGASVWETYWAAQMFLIVVTTGLTGWVASYATKSLYAWQSWQYRGSALITAMLNLSILMIFVILTCRFINNNSLNHVHLAQAAGIIIMWIGSLFYAASTLYLVHESFYTVGTAGAAVPPQGTQLVANVGPYAVDKYGEPVPTKVIEPVVTESASATGVVTQPAIYSTTQPGIYSATAPAPVPVVSDQNTGQQYPVINETAV